MDKKEKNDYVILFKGAKLSKREANKVGLSLIFGIIGIVVLIFPRKSGHFEELVLR